MIEFDKQKTIETILYIVNELPKITVEEIIKLICFADMASLENYGRFVTGDKYMAMCGQLMPVETYDLFRATQDIDTYGFKVINQSYVQTFRSVETDEFSDSDVICLDQVITMYRNCRHDSDSCDLYMAVTIFKGNQ